MNELHVWVSQMCTLRWRWCSFMVGFMPARHIYMRPAQIIIHSTVDSKTTIWLCVNEHIIHINYVDALNCTESASVLTASLFSLINFLCSWCFFATLIRLHFTLSKSCQWWNLFSLSFFPYKITLFTGMDGLLSRIINGKMRFGKVVQCNRHSVCSLHNISFHLEKISQFQKLLPRFQFVCGFMIPLINWQ